MRALLSIKFNRKENYSRKLENESIVKKKMTSCEIQVWTTEDVADFLRVTPDYVRSLVRQKLIPCHRLTNNGKILFTKSRVIEWFLNLEQEVEETEKSWDEDAQRNYIQQHLNSN